MKQATLKELSPFPLFLLPANRLTLRSGIARAQTRVSCIDAENLANRNPPSTTQTIQTNCESPVFDVDQESTIEGPSSTTLERMATKCSMIDAFGKDDSFKFAFAAAAISQRYSTQENQANMVSIEGKTILFIGRLESMNRPATQSAAKASGALVVE